jgi:hypothetical protein
MPDVNADRLQDMERACACGPAMRQMAASCCGVPEVKRSGSEEQEETTEEGGA